jgi:hypothetical protein
VGETVWERLPREIGWRIDVANGFSYTSKQKAANAHNRCNLTFHPFRFRRHFDEERSPKDRATKTGVNARCRCNWPIAITLASQLSLALQNARITQLESEPSHPSSRNLRDALPADRRGSRSRSEFSGDCVIESKALNALETHRLQHH